jgi:hypothetical protein
MLSLTVTYRKRRFSSAYLRVRLARRFTRSPVDLAGRPHIKLDVEDDSLIGVEFLSPITDADCEQLQAMFASYGLKLKREDVEPLFAPPTWPRPNTPRSKKSTRRTRSKS